MLSIEVSYNSVLTVKKQLFMIFRNTTLTDVSIRPPRTARLMA